MPTGRIVKALSGFYYVRTDEDDHTVFCCRARGIFKKRGQSPLVGDRVQFEPTEGQQQNEEGWITELMPRSNEMVRPPIANIDQAVLVITLKEPHIRLQLLDRFLVHCERIRVDVVICVNKVDLCEDPDDTEQLQSVSETYESIGYPVVQASTINGSGMDELRTYLNNRVTVLAGQSGVGKSSLINAIAPGFKLETADISRKLGRGKHTTRHVELLQVAEDGFVADTPGFSQLDFANLEAEQLSDCFREFRKISNECKFRGCLHDQEPGCAVIEAVDNEQISADRHRHYLQFLQEIQERKRRY